MKIPFFLRIYAGLLFLLSTWPATAELTWVFNDSRAEVVVADTQTELYVERLDRNIPFSNFRYPQVFPNGDIAFITYDPVKFGADWDLELHGAYLSPASGEGLVPIVEIQKQLVDSLELEPVYIRGLQTDGSQCVFQAVFAGRTDAIVHWSRETGTRLITSPDPTAPNHASWTGYADVSGELVLYNASDSEGKDALFLHHLGRDETRKLLNTDTPVALGGGRTFHRISPQNWIDGDRIVFRANWENDSHKAHAPHYDDRGSGSSRGIYGWEGVDFDRPETTAVDNLVKYLDGTEAVPLGDGEQFSYIASAPVSGDLIAFSGGWYGRYGVYTLREGVLQVVVDTHTEIPALFQGPFSHFHKWISIMPGHVAFIGEAESGAYQGIFLYDIEADTLYRLFDNRTPLEGKPIAYFEIGSNLLLGDQFAAMVRFRDRTSGIYLFRRSENGMRRR